MIYKNLLEDVFIWYNAHNTERDQMTSMPLKKFFGKQKFIQKLQKKIVSMVEETLWIQDFL